MLKDAGSCNKSTLEDKREGFYGLRSNSRWPHIRPDKHLQFPIYLAYTSSILKKEGHDVLAFDAVADELDSDKFYKKIENFNPEVVFIECSTPSFDQDIYNAGLIKTLAAKFFSSALTFLLSQKN